jgi:hypothetical protein
MQQLKVNIENSVSSVMAETLTWVYQNGQGDWCVFQIMENK